MATEKFRNEYANYENARDATAYFRKHGFDATTPFMNPENQKWVVICF